MCSSCKLLTLQVRQPSFLWSGFSPRTNASPSRLIATMMKLIICYQEFIQVIQAAIWFNKSKDAAKLMQSWDLLNRTQRNCYGLLHEHQKTENSIFSGTSLASWNSKIGAFKYLSVHICFYRAFLLIYLVFKQFPCGKGCYFTFLTANASHSFLISNKNHGNVFSK